MNVKLVNGDPILQGHLISNGEPEALFIDWIPTTSEDSAHAADLLVQTESLEMAIKLGIKAILFDRYQAITDTEASWLRKHKNIILTEPVIKPRSGFEYLPFWLETLSINELRIDDTPRPITLLYKGEIVKRLRSFEQFYIPYKMYSPESTVAYSPEGLIQSKIIQYESKGLTPGHHTFSEAQYTVIIGSESEYRCGYLDPSYIEALKAGCIPFIPNEHRYYRALPSVSHTEVWWYSGLYEKTYLGLLSDVYKCINQYYPEMKVQSVAQQIYNLLS